MALSALLLPVLLVQAEGLELALLRSVSEERMQADVRHLVTLGPRMGGTASGARAVAFRRERFAALGLETEVRRGPERWCHEASSWSLVAVRDGVRTPLERAWPWGFSPAVEGRFELSLEPAPGAALLAAELGYGRFDPQPALVLLDGETTPDGSYPKVADLRQRGGGAYRFPVFGLSAAEGAALRAALEAGPLEIEAELQTTIAQAAPETVVARLPAAPGSAPGFLLVCAHGDSDSGGPGANDNASGEAIVLEVARVLATAVREEVLPPLPAEVRFAIWGSEIHSTRAYLQEAEEAGETFLGVINYDQSGYGTGADCFYVEPDDLPANRALVQVIADLLADHREVAGLPQRWATCRSMGGTDSYVFSSSELFERASIPSLTLYTSAWDREAELERTSGMPGQSWEEDDTVRVDYDLFYHSAGDVPSNTTDREPWNMGWCARVGVLAVVRWAGARGG